MRLLNTAPHDAVTELLATLRVRSTVYCLSELREPWGFEVDGANVGPGRPPRAGLLPTGGDGSSRASSGPRRLVPGWLRTETARPRLAQDGDGSSGRPQDGNGRDRATTCCAPGFRPWLITSATSSTVVIP